MLSKDSARQDDRQRKRGRERQKKKYRARQPQETTLLLSFLVCIVVIAAFLATVPGIAALTPLCWLRRRSCGIKGSVRKWRRTYLQLCAAFASCVSWNSYKLQSQSKPKLAKKANESKEARRQEFTEGSIEEQILCSIAHCLVKGAKY